jgi:hypothetical protein
MKLALQQLAVRGPARMKYLAPDAAVALHAVERDTDGLIYFDMWRDPTASLLARRTRKGSQLPGYTTHGFGLAVDLDLLATLDEKKIRYEDLLYIMRKRGWYCHRRDGEANLPESEHFNFLGELAEKYLVKTTMDPTTWQRPAEERIYERYGCHFQVDLPGVQKLLERAGFYVGPQSGQLDAYTREAILAFQRAWDLIEDGTASMTLCRALVFVTAERQLLPVAATPA